MICPICTEHAFAWAYLSLSSAERWDIWRHAQTCALLAEQVRLARAQLAAKREAGELLAVPVDWIMPSSRPGVLAEEVLA